MTWRGFVGRITNWASKMAMLSMVLSLLALAYLSVSVVNDAINGDYVTRRIVTVVILAGYAISYSLVFVGVRRRSPSLLLPAIVLTAALLLLAGLIVCFDAVEEVFKAIRGEERTRSAFLFSYELILCLLSGCSTTVYATAWNRLRMDEAVDHEAASMSSMEGESVPLGAITTPPAATLPDTVMGGAGNMPSDGVVSSGTVIERTDGEEEDPVSEGTIDGAMKMEEES